LSPGLRISIYHDNLLYEKKMTEFQLCSTNTPIRCKRVKQKATPVHALTGPKGSRRLRLSYFKTIGTWRW